METMNTLLFRRRLAEKASQLLILFVAIALVTCPFLVPQPLIFIIIGIIDLIITFVVWYLVHSRLSSSYSAHLVIGASYLCVMPLILISGGVNSHFIYLVPVSPMMTGLLLNSRAAFVVSGFLVINIILLMLFRDWIPDYTFEENSNSQSLLRAYWIVLSTVITTIFVYFYEQFNTMLSARLQDQAFTDPLTGIANRRSIIEALHAALVIARSKNLWLSVIMIDLDHFKKLNDNNGHAVGDDCLVKTALCLDKCVRRTSDLVGRLGGEEFLAILPNVTAVQVARVAEQMRSSIENVELHTRQGGRLHITASLGCFTGKGEELESADVILRLADEAMYEAKNLGRNQVVLHFDDS